MVSSNLLRRIIINSGGALAIRLSLSMSNYSKTEALEFMKEKYRIAVAVKEYERAKVFLLKIRELEDSPKP